MTSISPVPGADSLFAQAACALVRTDRNGLILEVNDAACASFGYHADELIGRRRVQDLFTVGGQLFHQTHCVPLLGVQGSVTEVQLEVRHRDGSRIPVLLNMVRRQIDGAVRDDVALFVVKERRSYERELLTARKSAEAALEAQRAAEAQLQEKNEQLSRLDRKKDEFLATLAHELRNPLAPMLSGVELLKLKYGAEPGQRKITAVLERQLRQMAHLVDDLMEVSRITQGRLQLRCEALDLSATIGSAVADVQGQMDEAGHRLSVTVPELPVCVHGDATRLTQIFNNLLTNACKYTPPGGAIRLTLAVDGGDAVVSVRDSGIGIPAGALADIFAMFSQVEGALERSKGGLGIGLALVKGLVELHGGTVTAHSPGLGQGSEFTVRLPLAQPASPVDDDCGEVELRPLRILLVDDNVDAADTLAMSLEMRGHRLAVAHTGIAGLALAEQHQPDVALLDIGLPAMNGYELAARLRAQEFGREMVLIAVTGWGQPADKARALAAGFDVHLTKPVDLAALLAALRSAVQQAAAG